MSSIFIYPLTHRQDPTNSQFAMLPLFTLFSAKVAYRKDHVRTCHLYHLYHGRSPAHAMTRVGTSLRKAVITHSARPRETHATTRALESSVLIHGCEGLRRHCGKSYQTAIGLSRELGARIGSQGKFTGGYSSMVALF